MNYFNTLQWSVKKINGCLTGEIHLKIQKQWGQQQRLVLPPPSWCGWPRCGAEEAGTTGSCGRATAALASSTPRSSPDARALQRCNKQSAPPGRSWRGRWRNSRTLCLDRIPLRRRSPRPGWSLAEEDMKLNHWDHPPHTTRKKSADQSLKSTSSVNICND